MRSILKMKKIIASALFITFVAACQDNDKAISSTDGTSWKPRQNIELVAPSGAGGGWDTTARMVAKVLQENKIIEKGMGVINKTGGGGAIGWAYIASKKGNPHHLFVTSPPIIYIPLNGQSSYNYQDFTPIVNLLADYGAFAVRADAKWDNLNDLFEDRRDDPQSITVIGSSSPGSMNHLMFAQFADEAGVDIQKIKYISEQDGGLITNILNGSADVLSGSVSYILEQVRAGNMKVLAVTSAERLPGDANIFPTAKEQGIDSTYINWRGIFAPKDISPAAVKYYEEAFTELVNSDEWKAIRANYGWDEMFISHAEYPQFLETQQKRAESLLEKLNIRKR